MDTGLDADQQIAVRRGHDDGEDARQGQARQSDGQHVDGQGGDHSVGGAIDGQGVIPDDLVGGHAHEVHQGDGDAVNGGAQEHALLGGAPVLGGEGPLPHLRPGHGEDQVGDDVPQDAAVEIRLRQGRVQVRQEGGEAPDALEGGHGDENVNK